MALALIWVCSVSCSAPTKNFTTSYKEFRITNYSLVPSDNLRAFLALSTQKDISKRILETREIIKKCEKPVECRLMHFELDRIERRLELANELNEKKISSLSTLDKHPKLKNKFYRHSIYEWTNNPNFSFEEMRAFQKGEIDRIRKALAKLPGGANETLKSPKQAEKYLDVLTKEVLLNIKKIFTQREIKRFDIKRNKNKEFQHVPGYYDGDTATFYYTLKEGDTLRGDLDWLLLHEAVPGHHLQTFLDQNSTAQSLFSRELVYFDFAEGWGAYVETYGEQLGIYQSPQARRKALEWDLLRSVRVFVDIGIHHEGWTTEQAMTFWLKTAPEVKDLAEREIKRIQNWPGQVISYEYGKMKISQARDQYLKTGKTELEFHEKLLSLGQVPTFMIDEFLKL